MARKQSSMDSKTPTYDKIYRTAINSDGSVGSFYDGYREGISGQLVVCNEDKSNKLLAKTQCVLVKGKSDQYNNLLQIIEMPIELRMSVLVGLASKKGIASITDYPHQINECTCFLYYSYVHQEERISDKISKIQKNDNKSPTPSSTTTHIITGINYGIDVAIVLQLPSENDTKKNIHAVLKTICDSLNNNQSVCKLISDNEQLLEKMTPTTIYSNIPHLMEMSTLYDVCSYIDTNKNETMNYPIRYTLRPIKWMFPQYTGPGINFISTPSPFCEEVEQYLLEFSNTLEHLKHYLDTEVAPLFCGDLDKQLGEAQKRLLRLSETYNATIERFQNLIFEIRKTRSKIPHNDQMLINIKTKTSKDIDDITKSIEQLHKKGTLIVSLKKKKFIYCNAHNHHVKKKDNNQTLIRKLTRHNRSSKVFCTSDRLNEKYPEKYSEQHRLLVEQKKTNSDLDIVYADFSYCTFEPAEMSILKPSSNTKETKKKKPKKKSSSTKKTSNEASSSTIESDVINILLLGETGVGKSTFINAFVNYLTSETFKNAQSNEPVVLIPVSFMITTGNDFKEQTVKFGDFATSHSEDFDHIGESVTQHCKSYDFHLNRSDEKKLCIIDTPGFGDTRGLDQDDLNMQDILQYINTLTHLNAVCFLLKPNSSELHPFFRMCFTQLIDLLGPDIRKNIIFCFTNARSTFYAPGDTAYLLKSMLQTPAWNDIPFKKTNVFCFDNESFRYLVALQNGIEFNDLDRNEYEKSWSISVNESNRLIDYIYEELDICPMHREWQSNKHAQIEIIHLIRPMLEAIRNILRNIILHKMESSDKSIELYPKPMHRPSAVCSSCTFYPIRMGNFWIAHELTHEFQKKCSDCQCSTDKHRLINYVLNFEVSNTPSIYHQNGIIDKVYELCHAGAEFDFFLTHIVHSSKGPLFEIGLTRMIIEEDKLCQTQKPNHLNKKLFNYLTELKYQYDEDIKNFKSNQQQTSLTNIYKLIPSILIYPTIPEQLNTIKETQTMMTEPYEI